LRALFSELMALHYDPHYTRSQERHFTHWAARSAVTTGDLSDARLDALAGEIVALA